MVSMPYRWAKGPEWQMLELVLSTSDAETRFKHKRAVWKSLFDDAPLAKLNDKIAGETGEDAGKPVADAGLEADAAAGALEAKGWAEHLVKDWYGEDPETGISYSNPTNGTGWWSSWEGKPIEVVKEAMFRALEVSLGTDKATPRSSIALDGNLTGFHRNWPIELSWLCPVGNFQAAITRRHRPPDPTVKDGGVVSVAWMTPGIVDQAEPDSEATAEDPDAPDEVLPELPPAGICHCGGLRWDLRVVCGCADAGKASRLEPVLEEPAAGQTAAHLKRRGLWIVGQTITEVPGAQLPVATVASGKGLGFKTPNGLVRSWGPVVTVEPCQPDGGVSEDDEWGTY